MHPHTAAIDFNERPFILFWEVTRACALACKHCRAIAQPKAHPEELTHEEALALVDKIAELRPPMLVLTGGDPMMRAAFANGHWFGSDPSCYLSDEEIHTKITHLSVNIDHLF